MAVRKDQVQISIQFLTDENRQYAKTITDTDKLLGKLKQVQKSGGDVGDALEEIALQAQKVAKIDLSSLTPSQLITRSRQLAQAMKLIPQSAPQFKLLEAEQKRVNDALADMRSRTRGVSSAMASARQSTSLWQRALAVMVGTFGGLSLAGIGQQILSVARNLINVTAETQKYDAVLTNTLGSQEAAAEAFRLINEYTAETPFQINEVTESYVKLANRGLTPTREELVKLGDIAASQGKGLLQFSEALLDATTGEFERLKEFGIKARKENDEVTLSFKDQTVTVQNNNEAIKEAILAFGELQGVQGSTEAISKTLGGQISNLQDNVTNFLRLLGSGDAGGLIGNVVAGFNRIIRSVNDTLEPTQDARVEVIELQNAFNSEIAVLKGANLSQEERGRLISEINGKYGTYLGNLIEEGDSIDEIAAAQQRANNAFQQRLIYVAFQEEITEATNKYKESIQAAASAEKERARVSAGFFNDQEKALQDAPNAAAREQLQGLEEFYSGIRDQQVEFSQEASKETENIRSSYETLAEQLGTSLDEIFARFNQPEKSGGGAGSAGAGALEKRLTAEIKALETQSLAKQIILEQDFTDGLVSEKQYADELLAIRTELLNAKLALQISAKGKESEEALRTQQQLLQIEREGSAAVLAQNLEDLNNTNRDKELALAESLSRQRISEEQFQAGILELRRENLRQQLAARYQAGEEETQAVIELQQQLLQSEIDIRNSQSEQRSQARKEEQEKELDDIRFAFEQRSLLIEELTLQGLLTEEEAKEAENEARLLRVQEELEVLRANKDTEISLIRDKELEKKRIELEIGEQRIENERKVSEAKQKIEKASLDATSSFFSSLAGLLKATGKEGQKYVQFIKALEVASVIAKGISEIQSIYASAAATGNPAYALIANIQALAAGLRTATAVANINKVKAARGVAMKFGKFGGKDHSAGGTKGVFDDGTRIEVERDEVFAVINKRNSRLLGQLSNLNSFGGHGDPFFSRGGVMKFATGGLTNVNTTPQGVPITDTQQQNSAALDRQLEIFEEMNENIRRFPIKLQASVSYEEIEDTGSELNDVRDAASF